MLLVRLATAENQALTIGPGGLLAHHGTKVSRTRVAEPPPDTFATPGVAVCAEVWAGGAR